MKVIKTNSRVSSKDEFRKKLNDEEAEIYFIGLKRGFEQAKKQVLEAVKRKRDEVGKTAFVFTGDEIVEWLEDELK